MRREQRLARLFRALSGDTQEELGAKIGASRNLVSQLENGEVVASPGYLEAMAREAGITVAEGEQLLRRYDALRRSRRRWGRNAGEVFDRMAAGLRSHAESAYEHILTLGLPEVFPEPEDRLRAEKLFVRLERRSQEMRLVLVQEAEAFQTGYLCERVCRASVEAASRDIGEAADWAQLAVEIAARVRAPEGFRRRLQGYALGHAANVLRVSGKLKQADATLEEAKHLWDSGADPAAVLDPGRLLDLEASLRRGQRRFDEALALLTEAEAVGRNPERALTIKGSTLEVMGDYEGAVEALRRAASRLDRQADPQLWYNHRFNLAASLLHLDRYAEAAELVPEIREAAGELGDEIFLLRVTWLEGRIAAGLGLCVEALRLLNEARRGFERRKMSYDVALALLEEAVLLLEEGRTAEVRALAEELTRVFADKGVHREALAALRLFANAAKREEATAELGRRVLHFLFRARHDEGLRFES